MKELTGRQQTKLDIFRIAAATLVLMGHSLSFFELTIFKDQTYFPYIQCIGVVMLFTLSGYLTAYSLERNNINHDYEIKDFFLHKVKRIYREYFPGLLLITFIDIFAIKINGQNFTYYDTFNMKYFFGNLFMLQGTGVNHIPGIEIYQYGSGRPLWTISLEWWLYFLFGIFFICISNKRMINWKNGIFLLITIFLTIDYLRGVAIPFIIGIIAYYCSDIIPQRLAQFTFPASILVYIYVEHYVIDAYTISSYIIMGFIFISFIQMGKGREEEKRNPFISWVSKATFMLYLIHYSIVDMLFYMDCSLGNRTRWALSVIISIALSAAMYYIWGYKISIFSVVEKKYKNRNIRITKENE